MNSDLANDLMSEFARETGLNGDRPPRRYLWTDAFAVCTCLGLAKQTGDDGQRERALRLVDQVHAVLGRHREDDARSGWISGLTEEQGREHPTAGGLRVGKPLNERTMEEPLDQHREWDRDGQYFHYLTKWMHALHCVARSTGQRRYLRWAKELAAIAHDRFTLGAGGARRMVWKMSIDLSRPLVPAMGQHDPLDAWVTYLELHTAAPEDPASPDLGVPVTEARQLCHATRLATDDPLGVGGLLTDAARLAQLAFVPKHTDRDMFDILVQEAETSLHHFATTFSRYQPARLRLAFRELGLAIGLRALELTRPRVAGDTKSRTRWDRMLDFRDLGAHIEAFWSDQAHYELGSWQDHADINKVMLATSLAPHGYVLL